MDFPEQVLKRGGEGERISTSPSIKGAGAAIKAGGPPNFAGKWSGLRAHLCLKEGPTKSVPPPRLTRCCAALTATPPPVDQTSFSLGEQASNGGWHEPGFSSGMRRGRIGP